MARHYPPTPAFRDATVILPVVDETHSLRTTVEILVGSVADDLHEILIVDCERTSEAAREVIAELEAAHPELVAVHHQELPFLGGAMREAFDLAKGSHVVMMASDLETDPNDVAALIAAARRAPESIITASRWRDGGAFAGYSRVKLVANWIFQRAFGVLYRTHLTDMTYGYRLFPTNLVQAIDWQELRHPFLFETIVKPLRLGVPVVEIPSKWSSRIEGESSNTFLRNFEYFRTGVRVRFAPPASLLRGAGERVEQPESMRGTQ